MIVELTSFPFGINGVCTVFLNSETGVCHAEALDNTDPENPVSIAPPFTTTEEESQIPLGTNLLNGCVEHSFFWIVFLHVYPFAEVNTFTQNSAQCGFVACDVAIFSIDTSSPSFIGNSDGKAVVYATGSGAIQYSLDMVNWQAGNEFPGLISGTYIAYVRNEHGCLVSAYFSINAATNVFPQEVSFPYKDKVCRWFKLKVGESVTDIREPVKWDAFSITGERDMKWHGWNWQYSDGEVLLEFGCESGKHILETEKKLHGNDADVELLFGFTKDSIDYQLYQGKINFNTYKNNGDNATATVIRKDNMDLLQSRFDETISVADTETLGGLPIIPLLPEEITLHGKVFKTSYSNTKTDPVTAEDTLFDTSSHLAVFDLSGPTVNEIQNSTGMSGLVLAQNNRPYNLLLYQFKLENSGSYDINLSTKGHLKLSMRPITGVLINEDYEIKVIFATSRFGIPTETVLFSQSGTIKPNTDRYGNFDITYSQTFQLQAGDEVYLFAYAQMSSARRSRLSLYQENISLSIDATEVMPDSKCNVWLIGEIGKYGVKSATDNAMRLKSAFIETRGNNFATDGAFSLYVATNGYNIRRFINPERPLKTSLKDIFETVNAIAAAGMGLERNGAEWILRIEPLEYFYRENMILYIEEVSNYEESTATDLIYNSIEVGYEKYESEGIQQLDEFNTRREDVTPIKTHKNKFEKKSTYITSGYSIERSRRNQFSETPKESVTNDENAFMISVRRDGDTFVPERDEAFESVTNLISPETAYNLRVSPKRMLLNWWRWLKGSLFYKQPTEKIKNTFVDRNGELTTKFLATEPNPLGDFDRRSINEKSDVLLADYGNSSPIYEPDWVDITARLSMDDVTLINQCMSGADTQNRNYGYLMVKKPDGTWQAIWITKITYSYVTEKVEIRGFKKAVTPPFPVEQCCSWLVANGCWIKANGKRLVV